MVANRAQGAGQEFHDGTLHRRQNDKIQAACFRQQRMQSIHGRQTRARKRLERPATHGEGDKVIEGDSNAFTYAQPDRPSLSLPARLFHSERDASLPLSLQGERTKVRVLIQRALSRAIQDPAFVLRTL